MEFVFCSLIIALILALVVASIMMLIFGIQLLIDREWIGIVIIIFSIIILIVAVSLAALIFYNFF
jgi:hypothetical protein